MKEYLVIKKLTFVHLCTRKNLKTRHVILNNATSNWGWKIEVPKLKNLKRKTNYSLRNFTNKNYRLKFMSLKGTWLIKNLFPSQIASTFLLKINLAILLIKNHINYLISTKIEKKIQFSSNTTLLRQSKANSSK